MHHIVRRSQDTPPRMMWANVNPPATSFPRHVEDMQRKEGRSRASHGRQPGAASNCSTPKHSTPTLIRRRGFFVLGNGSLLALSKHEFQAMDGPSQNIWRI